jgi:hypothetical protein
MRGVGSWGLHVQLIVLSWVACLGPVLAGCSGSSSASPAQPDGKERISRLFNLYRAYSDANHKGPPNEQALKEFGQKLPANERADRLIGDDLESIFVSPRDNKKFVVRYNMKLDPSKSRAVIWEEDGKDGMHFVALSIGYTVEYNDSMLADAKK